MNHPKYSLLMMLYGTAGSTLNPWQLAEAAGEKSANITRLGTELCHEGPTERGGSDQDRRKVALTLTDLYGYCEETKLPQLHVGDPVDIRLMAGGVKLKGTITGIARGITDRDNPTGGDLLADVNPTFNWVRLAQRVPVRIAIDTSHVPDDTLIAAGMTATIEVRPRAPGK